jgi:hypothetical protein
VATVDIHWPERQWGLNYLGWSETIDGFKIPVPVMSRGSLVDRSIASLTKAHAKAKSKNRRRLIANSIAALKKLKRSPK